jgi:hypothetical protein
MLCKQLRHDASKFASTFNASINLRIKCLEREKNCGLEKKICNFKTVSEFVLRILSALPLTQGTSMRHCFIVCTASLNVKVIAFFILLARAEKEI